MNVYLMEKKKLIEMFAVIVYVKVFRRARIHIPALHLRFKRNAS